MTNKNRKTSALNLPVSVFITCLFSSSAMASDNFEYAAVIKSGKTAILSSQLDGLVNEVHVEIGDSFAEGDKLLEMDCSLPNATLSKARADVEFARNEYKSIKALNKLNSSTKVEVARMAAQFAIADADMKAAQYRVDRCVLTAPYDGVIVQSHINPHESVQVQEELFEIVSNTDLTVEFLAPSRSLADFYEGRSIQLNILETQKTYDLTVHKVIPVVDSVSQTVKVVSRIEIHDEQLWAGMSGRVSLVTIVAEDAEGL